MNGTPSWWVMSKRVWGIALTVIGTMILPLFGIGVDPEGIQILSATPDQLLAAFGVITSVIGSIKAKGGLSLTKPTA